MAKPSCFRKHYRVAFSGYLASRGIAETGTRKHCEAHPRFCAMYLAREDGLTLQRIGQEFSNDHKTVHYGIQRVKQWLGDPDKGPHFEAVLEDIRGRLQ